MAAVRPAMLAAAAAPAGLARAPTLCCGLRVPGPWVTMRARGRAAPPPLDLAPAGAFEAPSGPRVTRRGSRRWRLLACVLCAAVVYGLLQSGGASSSELPLPASAPCAAAELGLAAGGLLGGKARPRNCGWAGGRGRRLDGELQPSLCAISDTLQRARPWLPALPDAAQRLCVTLQHAQKRTFPLYKPQLHAWRLAAGPAFLKTSLLVAVAVIPVARHVLDLYFQRLGRELLPAAGVTCSPEDVTFTKWREACWRLATYALLTVFGVVSCAAEPWVADTKLLLQGWPAAHVHSAPLQQWYAIEMGLYMYSLADLLLWEAPRGDYYAMILHHVATLTLLGGSFYYSFLRAGAIIMMVNDFVDFWFEGAKLAKYAAAENVSTAFFLAFVASWAWLRQIYTPFNFWYSVAIDGWGLVEQYGPSTEHVVIWAVFLLLIIVVIVLHTYWFVFLLQKIKVSVSINVSIKVVDRRPGAVVEESQLLETPASPGGLNTHTAKTLLEED